MQFPKLKSGGEVGVTALSPGHQSPLEVMKWFGTSVCAWKSLHIGEFHCRLMECPPTMTLVTFNVRICRPFSMNGSIVPGKDPTIPHLGSGGLKFL